MAALNLAPEFGYVVLVAASTALLNLWQGMQISKMRKKLKIPYPKMAADKPEPLFDCYVRAHLNTLENVTQFITLLITGGISRPCIAAGAGAVWVLGRVGYSLGYYTGEPKNRFPGFMMTKLSEIVLLYCSVSTAANMLGWW